MPDSSLSRPRAVVPAGAMRALIVCTPIVGMLIVGTLIVWALGVCAARAADPPASTQAPAPAANPATAQELPQVVVIANAPLSGLGLPANEIPANVQTADSGQMQRQQSLDLADYLNAGFSGVSASGSAANPFQMDVNYHGFTASPLLGTPEGLSVYVDGVRVNESFGDTVNWDLFPQAAISTVTLMSGSNPGFGLSTLGGALLLRTRSGHDNPGTGFEATGGSFGLAGPAGLRQSRLTERADRHRPQLQLRRYPSPRKRRDAAEHVGVPAPGELYAGSHRESPEFRESRGLAVPDRNAAPVRQRLLPPFDHQQQQYQCQRRLPFG